MCKPGFDGLSLSGCCSVVEECFPLTLSLSKGERAFIDTLFRGNDEARLPSRISTQPRFIGRSTLLSPASRLLVSKPDSFLKWEGDHCARSSQP